MKLKVLDSSSAGNGYANGEIASRLTGVCQRNILQVANGEEYKPGKIRKQAGGFVWKLKEESEVV